MSVQVEGLTKRFQRAGAPAVHGVDFETPKGGITTLLGPSGSGKTTLLRIIAGLENSDEGRVLVDGEDITRIPVRDRGFGFVFQAFALFGHMTVLDNIAFGLRMRRVPKAQRRVRAEELLQLVQLEGLGHRYPRQLSGGQRQRVGFARALAPSPKLLLLDEPFGALDARVRVELREWLRQLHEKTHLTTILVTHDQDEALDLSDHLVVMDKGRIKQMGTPEEVYDHPSSPFVASFIGSANILNGTVSAGKAIVASIERPVPSHVADGLPVRAIIRPHDVRVARLGIQNTNGQGRAIITRITNLGAHVKLELRLGEVHVLIVHVSHREFSTLKLALGEPVFLDLSDAHVYVEDYVI